jgi:hypothetical protein
MQRNKVRQVRRQTLTNRSIQALQNRSLKRLREDILSFPQKYVNDWNDWMEVNENRKAVLFGAILRRWQATRPRRMRRARADAIHPAPFLDDMLVAAEQHLQAIKTLSVETIRGRTPAQNDALHELWRLFSGLALQGMNSCVGVTKAVLLLTEGRVGPALDSRVRRQLRIPHPTSPDAWIRCLERVSDDIQAFELQNGALPEVVPEDFAGIPRGRRYDMILGPRRRTDV